MGNHKQRAHIFLVMALTFTSCFAGAIISCYACFSTPSMSTDIYTLQFDVSQINLTLVFPPYSGYSDYQTVISNYSFENSGLSPVYRIGLFGYCGGDMVERKFVKDHCIKNDPAFPLNLEYVLKREINTNMTLRTFSESDINLPASLPSKNSMRRKSLDLYGGTMTGMGLAIWCTVCCVLFLVGLMVEISVSSDQLCLIVTCSALYFSCSIFSCASWIALVAGVGGAQATYKDVAKAFSNQIIYGISVEVGDKFFGLIYGAFACMLLFWLTQVYLLVRFAICKKVRKAVVSPDPEINELTIGSEQSFFGIKKGSNQLPKKQVYGSASSQDLPTYEQSQKQYHLLGLFN